MVSLRKNTSTPKFLFSEGEKVLCYEPDANKAKVLYDSKILDIIPRDNSNRSTNKKIEYSVHFYGWSKSYNRKVSEELLLKDTVSNRKLQRELAQQAADQLKGKRNLKLNKIPNIIKEVITNNVISPLDENEKFEQTLNVDSIFGEDSSNSNFYTTNSNSTINELESTNQNNLPNNFQTAVSALTNQTIKSVNDANLFTIVNNQITNCINQPISDNIELCQQIITNLDEEIKNLLEKDQYRICEEENLYDLPVNIDYSVHKILNEYEQFSLRMLNSSNQLTNLNCKKISQYDKKDQLNQINKTVINNQTNTRSNRLNNQSSNQITNQILNNFNSTNSNNSTSSSSSLNYTSNGSNKEIAQISNPPFTNQTILEFTNSIEIYFNTLTDRMYIFYNEKEKKQFLKLKQDENYNKPIHTFGFIHLLRLIILLPDFLSICTIPNKKLKQVFFFLDNFCKYLVDNQTKFISFS